MSTVETQPFMLSQTEEREWKQEFKKVKKGRQKYIL